jgi:NAD(P)-dependent dehydrogenase (short-subunit alcohol dehydrogenase family)
LLAGRRADRLDAIATDLRVRGAANVLIEVQDLGAVPASEVTGLLAGFVAQLGGLDHVLLAYGVLGEQALAERQPTVAADIIQVNFSSAALWALAVANQLETQGAGSLVVLGSVAGDRGRRSNYVYGATKAGLAALVQGIAHRFGSTGPHAVIVKPGPIDTPMTAGMKKGGPIWASADAIALIVRRAAERRDVVVYAPARWRLIMLIIRLLPSTLFHRTKL